MNISRLYSLGKRKHEFGFRGMLVAVVLIGSMPGGTALFAYEGWKSGRIEWIAFPMLIALAIAGSYSLGIVLSANRSERDLKEFKLRTMGIDKLGERIAEQAKWNPEAKEALERYFARVSETQTAHHAPASTIARDRLSS